MRLTVTAFTKTNSKCGWRQYDKGSIYFDRFWKTRLIWRSVQADQASAVREHWRNNSGEDSCIIGDEVAISWNYSQQLLRLTFINKEVKPRVKADIRNAETHLIAYTSRTANLLLSTLAIDIISSLLSFVNY